MPGGPQGFGGLAALVTESDGEICELSSGSPTNWRVGAMRVTNLGGLDGMAFRYDNPHTTSFTMRNTVMPLSIVFFVPTAPVSTSATWSRASPNRARHTRRPPTSSFRSRCHKGGWRDSESAGTVLELFAEGCSST